MMENYAKRLSNLLENEKNKLILNPVENLPYMFSDLDLSVLEGLYITDKVRNEEAEKNSKILFGGRREYSELVLEVYDRTRALLGASDVTFRPLSGLHAHMLLFLSVGGIGNRVLLLSESGGGHFATEGMLKDLKYKVDTLPLDYANFRVDIASAIRQIKVNEYDFLFVDRSEGLEYEDFSELTASFSGYKIFDASQYLTNIICGDFRSPFDMGFDMILSTVHKNFPGGQKAIYAVKESESDQWFRLMNSCRAYVSSLHAKEILQTGLTLERVETLSEYSKAMLENAITLEQRLFDNGVDVVRAKNNLPHTAHIWLKFADKDSAYTAYKKLEQNNILVNYRKLPYDIGYGIRMGTCAATLQGLRLHKCGELAAIIADIIGSDASVDYREMVRSLIDGNDKRI